MEFSRSGKRKYQDTEFLMGDPRKALIHIDTERDLGVTLSSSLKFSKHINIQANKATGILGQLRRTFRHWNIDTFKTLYCAFVRPHLEYAAVVWSPSSKKDIRLLENVQRRATKLIPRIRNWNYSDRLRVLGLTSLQDRRKRGDLIQLFKISNGFNVVKWVNPIPTSNSLLQTGPASAIRGHQRRLSGQNSTKCIQRENFFTNRVINDWNSLPVNVIASNSINQFKNSYDNWKSGVWILCTGQPPLMHVKPPAGAPPDEIFLWNDSGGKPGNFALLPLSRNHKLFIQFIYFQRYALPHSYLWSLESNSKTPRHSPNTYNSLLIHMYFHPTLYHDPINKLKSISQPDGFLLVQARPCSL